MFILSIENSPGSVEGSGSTQMTPKLENKAFSGKFTQYIQSKRHKEPPLLRLAKEKCSW
jgi:hypothetical protein